MASWPNGQVPVYTDLGNLGVLTNARANEMVAFATNQWSERPDLQLQEPRSRAISRRSAWATSTPAPSRPSSGRGTGAGSTSSTTPTARIMTNFFGLPPTGVLGITNIDYVGADSPGDPRGVDGPLRTGDPRERSRTASASRASSRTRWGTRSTSGTARRTAPCGTPTCTTRRSRKDAPRPGPVGRLLARSRRCTRSAPPSRGTAASTWEPSTGSTTCPRCRTSTPLPAIPKTGGRSAARSWMPSGAPVMGVDVIARNVADPFNDFTLVHLGAGHQGRGRARRLLRAERPDAGRPLRDLHRQPSDRRVLGAEAGRAARSRGVLERRDGKRRLGEGRPLRVGDRGRAARRARHGEHHVQQVRRRTRRSSPRRTSAIPTDITPDGSVVVGGLRRSHLPVGPECGHLREHRRIPGGSASISDDGTKIASASPGHGRNRQGRDLRERRLDRDPAGSGIDPVRPGRKRDGQQRLGHLRGRLDRGRA